MKSKPLALVAALTLTGPALAKDSEDCLPGLICASNPATVVKALQNEGYKAKLDKDDGGDPMVSSAASGTNFDIFFYGCDNAKQCEALQLSATYTSDGNETAEIINQWNRDKRYGRGVVDDKGRFRIQYDITTVGGMNARNFKDALDIWSEILGGVAAFWDKYPAPKKVKS